MSLSTRIGAFVGSVAYRVSASNRRVALTNLAIAFPDRSVLEHQRILQASCRNLGRMAAEFCHLPRLDADELATLVSFEDRDHWRAELERAERTGAIILTAHFGNWELLAHAHGVWGHPITLVHRPMRNHAVDAAIDAVRSCAGTRSIPKKAAAKEAIRTLRSKGILVIPSDQNQPARDGVFVDFFGVSACTNAGAARLAALTGVPVIPVFLVRDGESLHHRIVVLPDVQLVDTGDRQHDAVVNTERCSKIIEQMLHRYPEQWIWFHKRWKTRPEGEPRIYAS